MYTQFIVDSENICTLCTPQGRCGLKPHLPRCKDNYGIQYKSSFLLYMFTLFLCLNCFFLLNAAAQVNITLVDAPDDSTYTFESIDVEGVEFLAVTASSDFEDYAGYTKSTDGKKEIAFTIIDGVFTTYDFPGSQKTHFYALGNDGNAAGYFVDSDGLHRGVVLENGELATIRLSECRSNGDIRHQ